MVSAEVVRSAQDGTRSTLMIYDWLCGYGGMNAQRGSEMGRHQTPGHHKAQPTASGDDIVIN